MTADLFSFAAPYPATPGHQSTDTSVAAAAAIAPCSRILREKVLAEIERSTGLTADEASARVGVSILSGRPRVTELARLGLVRDSGHRRKNGSGRMAIVWSAVTPARLKAR